MSPIFLLSGIGMVLVGFVFILYWTIRTRINWIFVLLGAFAWLIAVILKWIASLPMQSIINYLKNSLPSYIAEPLGWLYIGLLTGIFECGIVLVYIYLTRIKNSTWQEGVGFGIGFGGFEAVLVGVGSFFLTLLVICCPNILPPEVIRFAQAGNDSPLVIPADILERITAIFIHILSCLLIIYAVQNAQWKWFWISFIYKTTIDAIAGYLHLTYGVENLTLIGRWIFEIAVLPYGIVGAWGTIKLKNKWRNN